MEALTRYRNCEFLLSVIAEITGRSISMLIKSLGYRTTCVVIQPISELESLKEVTGSSELTWQEIKRLLNNSKKGKETTEAFATCKVEIILKRALIMPLLARGTPREVNELDLAEMGEMLSLELSKIPKKNHEIVVGE